MKLYELIVIVEDYLDSENLGDGWLLERFAGGMAGYYFEIQYKNYAGGIKVEFFDKQEPKVKVSRFFGGKEKEFFFGGITKTKEMELADIHVGVAERCRYVYGF